MRTAKQTDTSNGRILGAVISLLALADGVLHFALDYVMFHGRLWGAFTPGPPPAGGPGPGGAGGPPVAGGPGAGGPPPGPHFSLPLPNNELFILNALGYVGLVAIFWFGSRLQGIWRLLIDAVFAVYAAFSIYAWWEFGKPNPDGLGYTAKALEVVLIGFLIAHAVYIAMRSGRAGYRAVASRRDGALS